MRFNCKFREEFLKMNWFTDRSDAKMVIESRQRHYNEVRHYSSLRNETPFEFKHKVYPQRPD